MAEPRKVYRKGMVRRVLSGAAAGLGVRYYDMLYGERNLAEPIGEVERVIDLDIAVAGDAELEGLIVGVDEATARAWRHSMGIGSVCYVARSGGVVAGYSWVNRSVIDLVGMTLMRLPDGGAYTYGSYVAPAFRGKKVFQHLTRAVYGDMAAAGCRWACNLVDRRNTASIVARQRLGARFQRARILKLPGCRLRVVGRKFVMGVS